MTQINGFRYDGGSLDLSATARKVVQDLKHADDFSDIGGCSIPFSDYDTEEGIKRPKKYYKRRYSIR